jgi:hypothetical protein
MSCIGYTVLKSDFGEFVYAKLGNNGKLLPTTARVGRENPKNEKGIEKNNLRPTHIDCRGKICEQENNRRNLRGSNDSRRRVTSITSGTLKNLVIPMRWAGHDQRTIPSRDDIDILMNHQGPNPLCPTGSVRDVFFQNSYGALTLESTVVDWVPMDQTEQYYANSNSG